MIRHGIVAAAMAASVGLLFASYGVTAAARHTASTGAPILIGVVTSETGPLADYGQQEIRGLKIGIAYATHGTYRIGNRPIELLIRDDAADPAQGAQQMRTLILQNHVVMVQGPADSAVAIPMEQLAGEYKIPLIIDPAADDDLTTTYRNPYVFRTAANTYMYAAAYADYLKVHGVAAHQSFYQFAPDYAFGTSSVKDWARALTAAGGRNLGVLYAPITTTDFSSYIDKILALKPLPQELVVTWAGVGAITLFKQMEQAGLYQKMKVIGAIGGYNGLKALGQAANGFIGVTDYYYTLPHTAANAYLIRRYEALYHLPPDLFAGTSFAAGEAMVAAIEKAHSTNAGALVKALTGMVIQAPKGPEWIRPADHQALQPMYVVRLEWNPKLGYAAPVLLMTVPGNETAPPLR
jgi:branched-chain amino acid transport system substrate-binding protein